MKLKVGMSDEEKHKWLEENLERDMYVRTKCGIEQIYRIDNNKTKYKYLYKLKKQDGDGCIDCGCLCIEDIIGEPSFNPIDLVQENDFVNGEKVIRIFNPTFLSMGELPYVITDKSKYEPQDIKSIVTKEAFSSVEYRVEND